MQSIASASRGIPFENSVGGLSSKQHLHPFDVKRLRLAEPSAKTAKQKCD